MRKAGKRPIEKIHFDAFRVRMTLLDLMQFHGITLHPCSERVIYSGLFLATKHFPASINK